MDSQDLVEECPANNNHPLKRNKLTLLNIMNSLESKKKPLPNKSERLSEEKHLNSIPIKEVILINSKKLLTLMKS